MLDMRYGDLGEQAKQFAQVAQLYHSKSILMGPVSGTNFSDTIEFHDERRLAVHLYFDAVVTTRNALGRAAVATRKFYVFSMRIANLPFTMRDADCILPIAIVPPAAWSRYGFDGIVGELCSDFTAIHEGARECMI